MSRWSSAHSGPTRDKAAWLAHLQRVGHGELNLEDATGTRRNRFIYTDIRKEMLMKCCGEKLRTMQIQLVGRSYVLHRCGECNRRAWRRDGDVVAFNDVSAAMALDAAMITKARKAVAPPRPSRATRTNTQTVSTRQPKRKPRPAAKAR